MTSIFMYVFFRGMLCMGYADFFLRCALFRIEFQWDLDITPSNRMDLRAVIEYFFQLFGWRSYIKVKYQQNLFSLGLKQSGLPYSKLFGGYGYS